MNIFYFYKFNLKKKKKCLFTSKQNKLNKHIDTQKEKFTQLDLQDVEVREKIKHCKSKNKKLQKQLEKDKEKVGPPAATHSHMVELHQCLSGFYRNIFISCEQIVTSHILLY